MTYKVDKSNFIPAWVEALRSGKYEKGKGALRSSDNKFCCLGVLCEVAGLEPLDRGKGANFAYEGTTAFLPADLALHLEINPGGDFKRLITVRGQEFGNLAGVNDGTGLDFNEIADLIEAQVKDDNFRID